MTKDWGIKEWGLDEWIQYLELAYGEGMVELDDLDKVELLDLLKELEKRKGKMTIQEAIERLREGVPELPVNAVEYNRGYLAAIRDLEDIAREE